MTAAMPRRPSTLSLVGLAAGLVLVLFGPTMFGFQRLVFRDVGHFYAPLYQFIGEAGSLLPLWNPFDHTGIPIAGESTTALFYPPRWIFALGLPSSIVMGWYIAVHVLLAFGTAAWLAKRIGCALHPSLIAGTVYAFSGPVLFLYCNPPFLVGAAWMPMALGGAVRLIESWSAAAFLSTSFALAMCTLGGDPQTTVHVGLFIGGLLLWRQIGHWRSLRRHMDNPLPVLRPRWGPVLCAALFAAVLAAPQIAASIDWSRHSARRYEPAPGLTRLLLGAADEERRPWWQHPAGDAHSADVYDFSVAPWLLFDWLVPKLSGELFPRYQRLSALLPHDSRVWTITLYIGVVPLLVILARYASMRHKFHRAAWDVWDALIPVGLLLSFGSYGPMWLLKVVAGAWENAWLQSFHDALFAPYWWLVTAVPGYGTFRYPAKWLPFVILGASLATGRGLSRLEDDLCRRMRWHARWIICLNLVVGCAAGLFLLWPGGAQALAASVPPDSFWGPLAWDSALVTVLGSCLHMLLATIVASRLLKSDGIRRRKWHVPALGCLVAVDLLFVAYDQVATIDRHAELRLLEQLAGDTLPLDPWDRVIRARVGRGWPDVWRHTSDPDRLLEVETSGRHALFGRWHLEHSIGVLNSATSIVPHRTETFWRAAIRHAKTLPADQRRPFWRSLGRVLAVDAFVSRSEEGAEQRDAFGGVYQLVDLTVRPLDESLPLIRWHEHWRTIQRQEEVSEQVWEQTIARWQREGDEYVPIVESDKAGEHVPSVADARRANGATVHVTARTSDAIMIEVTASKPGLLLVSQFQDGHWQANVRRDGGRWMRLPVHAVDYLGQGVILPAGHWQVQFAYQPPWLYPSLLISVSAFTAMCVFCAFRYRRH